MLIDHFRPALTNDQKARLHALLALLDQSLRDRPWMLYGGSLLGCVLWGDLLPWDDDIDVVTTLLPADIKPMRFSKIRMDYGSNPLIKVFDSADPQVPGCRHSFPFIDVSMIHESGPFIMHPSTHGSIDRFPREIVFPLHSVLFGTGSAMAPNDPVALLKLKYGQDCFTTARTPQARAIHRLPRLTR
jgi:hypothetical protein